MTQLVLSLFSGVGMLDAAFADEGFIVARGPDLIYGSLHDVRTFHPPADRFDGVIGGPPCQSFSSLACLVRARGYEPKFGNLIPEFARCVSEAAPAWFLMENVPQAPVPSIEGYAIHDFVLDNCALDGGDGYGLEQERKRRITFGLRGALVPVDLRRWITPAVFLLPLAVDNSAEAKGRRQCVLSDTRAVPVALGGSGKPKRTRSSGGEGRGRTGAVTSIDGAATGMMPMKRYGLAEMLHLQGLPPDFLEHAPFTMEGKKKAVANGVPIPTGRALARAIREALGLPLVEREEAASWSAAWVQQ